MFTNIGGATVHARGLCGQEHPRRSKRLRVSGSFRADFFFQSYFVNGFIWLGVLRCNMMSKCLNALNGDNAYVRNVDRIS